MVVGLVGREGCKTLKTASRSLQSLGVGNGESHLLGAVECDHLLKLLLQLLVVHRRLPQHFLQLLGVACPVVRVCAGIAPDRGAAALA